MSYNSKHISFLQYFMNERLVSETDAKKINDFLFPEKTIDNTIEIINIKITALQFKINKVICEQDGNVNYVFIATFSDEFNCKPNPYKRNLLSIANFMFENDGFLSADELDNNPIFDTYESSINCYIKDKYLITDEDNNYYMSPMAMSEMETHLVTKFDNKRCMGCMNIVGYGIQCQSCNKIAHGHCLSNYFKNVGSKKCPKCSRPMKVDWKPLKIIK